MIELMVEESCRDHGAGRPIQEGLRTPGFLWLDRGLEPKPMPTIHRYFAFTYYPRQAAEENG